MIEGKFRGLTSLVAVDKTQWSKGIEGVTGKLAHELRWVRELAGPPLV